MIRTGVGTRGSGFGSWSFVFGVVVVVFVAALLAACNSKTTPTVAEPFPQAGEVAGWAKHSATRTFPADRLWEYIDGDAERYIQAGVVRTLTSDYQFQGRIDAVVDIYLMSSAEGPRKLFESESSADSQPARLGDEARLFASSLFFRKGPYLVRVIAYEEGAEISKALLELGQGIEKKLAMGAEETANR